MSNIGCFLKQNKIRKENVKYPVTASLVGEDGKPLEWEIRPISTAEDNAMRFECTKNTPHPENPDLYIPQLQNDKYLPMLIASSVVEPNLHNAELQDSYEVRTPEELLLKMVDNPGEYYQFANFVQEYNGFKNTLQKKIEEVKN